MWIVAIILFLLLLLTLAVLRAASDVCLKTLQKNEELAKSINLLKIKLFGREDIVGGSASGIISRFDTRIDDLITKLFGNSSCCDPLSDKIRVGSFGKIEEMINKNSKEIDDANKFTSFATNELEKYFGIKYEKKVITTNGVEKDVSKYVRSGRRQ